MTDTLVHMRDRNLAMMEPTLEAEDDWLEEVNVAAYKTLYPLASSWYMGANIPDKPRIFMAYLGGVPRYRAICDDSAANSYAGFQINGGADTGAVDYIAHLDLPEEALALLEA